MKEFDREFLQAILIEGARNLQLDLTARQLAQLMDYLALLSKWNSVYNLTAIRKPCDMVTHHLLDALAAVQAFTGAKNVLDVGAGGGVPGVVLAIWAAEAHSNMHISMIDTVQKKTAFLMQVKAELKLSNLSIHTARVEQLQVANKFDVITSRAFADLNDFVAWSAHLLLEHGQFIAMKGVLPEDEIARLSPGWQVEEIRRLNVPGLDVERHLIFIKKIISKMIS